jgi:hypothetical protein
MHVPAGCIESRAYLHVSVHVVRVNSMPLARFSVKRTYRVGDEEMPETFPVEGLPTMIIMKTHYALGEKPSMIIGPLARPLKNST